MDDGKLCLKWGAEGERQCAYHKVEDDGWSPSIHCKHRKTEPGRLFSPSWTAADLRIGWSCSRQQVGWCDQRIPFFPLKNWSIPTGSEERSQEGRSPSKRFSSHWHHINPTTKTTTCCVVSYCIVSYYRERARGREWASERETCCN